MKMVYLDYAEQGYAYHVINIVDLEKTLAEGIKYDDKATYDNKYYEFHIYFDHYKPAHIPEWVERSKAIFASICFSKGHTWHSHSAILRVKIQMDRCWVCNENLANFIYEPFILQHMEGFEQLQEHLKSNGETYVLEYWNNSLSYNSNLNKKCEKEEGYDAEILIMHPIPPEHIECLYIVADHQIMSFMDWRKCLNQYRRYLQPNNTSSAWNTLGSQ
jgi:hypothetical protein